MGLQTAEENEYLDHWLETPGGIRENLLNRLNKYSILAIRLHSIISHMNSGKKYKWSKVMNTEWRKQTISIKEDIALFENSIGITSLSHQSTCLM